MQLKRAIAVVLTWMPLIIGACGPAAPAPTATSNITPGGGQPPPVVVPPLPPAPGQSPDEVWTDNRTFRPGILTVPAGTNVIWINKDPEVHTVVSDTGIFLGVLPVGGSYNNTFNDRGTYKYYCDLHPGMAGTIHVR